MDNFEIIDVDTKDLREKNELIKKIANDYSEILKDLYDCFSKLKDNEVLIGSGNVDVFINTLKSGLVNYNKLSTEMKKHFELITDFSDELDSVIKRIEDDKIIFW